MNVLTVTQINRIIKQDIENHPLLRSIQVTGEVSNFNIPNGIAYFNLKDSNSYISCLVFNSILLQMKFQLEEGQNIVVHGRVSVYERDGVYQLYIDDMQPDGVGELALAFEQLKEKLSKSGLFDRDRKLSLKKKECLTKCIKKTFQNTI